MGGGHARCNSVLLARAAPLNSIRLLFLQPAPLLLVPHLRRHAKVGQLDLPRLRQQDVAALDVAVHLPRTMQGVAGSAARTRLLVGGVHSASGNHTIPLTCAIAGPSTTKKQPSPHLAQ